MNLLGHKHLLGNRAVKGAALPTGPWASNTGIISGLTSSLYHKTPAVFYIGTNMYLISGQYDGLFSGWKWSGTAWASNTSIVSGLTDLGILSAPTVFYIGTDLYLIACSNSTPFNGWKY